jgi:hypothetical protein
VTEFSFNPDSCQSKANSAKLRFLMFKNPQSAIRNPQSSHGPTESRPTVMANPQSAIRNPQSSAVALIRA